MNHLISCVNPHSTEEISVLVTRFIDCLHKILQLHITAASEHSFYCYEFMMQIGSPVIETSDFFIIC